MKVRTYGGIIVILLLALVSATAAQRARRIQFERGRTTAVLKGRVKEAGSVEYLLRAQQGQTMSVHLTSPDDPGMAFYIYRPGGRLIDDLATANVTDWSGELPREGDYRIVITPTGGDGGEVYHYTLEVTIR